MEYLRANPNVCFTVGRQSGTLIRHPGRAKCNTNHDSVIFYGRARIVEDINERSQVLNIFNHCLCPDATEVSPDEVINCLAIEIIIHKMTSRKHRKGIEHTYREFYFR